MIFLSNISFAYVILFILIYNLSQFLYRNKQLSNWLLVAGSIIVLTTILTLQSIAIVTLISLLVYWMGKLISKKDQKKQLIKSITISILLILFVIKNYNLANFDLLQRVGLSYILFRLIHFIIESSKNNIQDYNTLSFINYIIFFPTFIAGPIDQYNNFNYWIAQKHRDYKSLMIKAGLFKLSLGILKKFFIVPIIVNYSLDYSLFDQQVVWQGGFLISLFLYSFYILFDFSGYSDIAIGTAYLIGIKTPENFDNPYSSKNLSVFWKKWHMTFSNFLFKYVFKPFVVNLSSKYKSLPRLLGSSIGYIYTFILCGLWHGNTLNFVYWGLWHGIGLILFKIWDIYFFKKKIIHRLKANSYKYIYNTGAVIVTFIYVTFGWFFFNYQTSNIHTIIGNIFSKNNENMIVSSVKYENKNCLEIQYTPKSPEDNTIDLQYELPQENLIQRFENIPVNQNGKYYILDGKKNNHLVKINIRSKSDNHTGKWLHQLQYVRSNNYQPTDIQSMIFNAKPYHINRIEGLDTLYGQFYTIESYYSDQEITSEIETIENYGIAIKLNYLPKNDSKVTIDYKYENNEWINAATDREGKYHFFDIHGNESYNGTNRNVKPGKYSIRLKYLKDEKSSQWIYSELIVPNYVND